MTCPQPITDTIYLGRDNLIRMPLQAFGAALTDLSALTRVTVTVGEIVIDSDVVGSSVIWWTDSVTDRGITTDVLTMKLGGQSITAGTYTDVAIVIYDATYANGLLIETPIKWVVE